MRFDPISFLLGFLSSSGIAFVLWRARARLARLQESTEAQIAGTRRFIGRSAQARYCRDLLNYLQQHHIAGSVINLTDILLEPRLIPADGPVLARPDDEETQRSVFDVVPLIHSMPQSYALYNIETLGIDEIGIGARHVAILGSRGTGKTTTLATLALMAFGEVEFESLEDLTEQAILEEEQSLSEDERRMRARERQQIEERAIEKLHDAHQREREKLLQTEMADELPPVEISGLLPVFIHLCDLDFDAAAYGRSDQHLDPSEPVIRAAQQHVSGVTAQVVGSVLYPALENGRALILIDGYDELEPSARDMYFHWLRQFLETYGQNLTVITGPAEGYEPLMTLGFTPTFLRPWREDDYDQLARRWGNIWTPGGKRRVEPPSEQALRRITADNRGRNILDVSLKIWAGLAEDVREPGRGGWYDAWITRRLSKPDAGDWLALLASQMIEAGSPVTRASLLEAVAGTLPAPEEGKKAAKPEDMIDLDDLVRDGLLKHHANDTFSFVHPMITSYLASKTLLEGGSDLATQVALDPAWQDALGFAAVSLNMLPPLYRRLSATPDLIYSNLFGLVSWLPDAPVDAPWRGDVFKRLAAALMAPDQYPAMRERAMAALIAARDKNVLYVFQQALRAADPDIQRLACIGLGALGSPEAIKDIAPLLGSDNPTVQLAAGLALGAIGTEHALENMVQALVHGSEDLRRAVAETLAAIPNEGHSVLRDGIESDDIMIRRATVYGLSRVRSSWAVVALYRIMLEDEQWYVRTAAEEAFMAAQAPERAGLRPAPEADSLVWLIQWAADKGEGVPAGPNARQVLVRALQEGQPVYQAMAATTLGNMGHVPALKALYGALRERHPEVRSAAYHALASIQTRMGEPLPGLV
ncbi:MAG: HEAT repeat domain-containing protein [Anaerolineae bacterium]|nr:HEAT repeat domain-containing protein [Anaerolineae bacterium]